MSAERPSDPFELFRAMNPFDGRDTEDLSSADEELLARILTTPIEEQPEDLSQRPSRRRLAIIASAVVIATLATAAFASLRSQPVTNPVAVVCYATADVVDGDRVGLGSELDPIEACRAVWRDGDLKTDGSVPPLVGCVNAAGAAAVFPGEGDVCERLGLPTLEEGLSDEQVSIIEMQDSLIDTFLDRCFTEDAAVAEARRQLEAAGLEDWTAQVAEAFPDDGPCAGVGVDPDQEIVILVGVRSDES